MTQIGEKIDDILYFIAIAGMITWFGGVYTISTGIKLFAAQKFLAGAGNIIAGMWLMFAGAYTGHIISKELEGGSE